MAWIMLITGASLYFPNVRKDEPRRLTYVRMGWALVLYSGFLGIVLALISLVIAQQGP